MSDTDTVCYILLKDISSKFTKGCLMSPIDKTRQVYMSHGKSSGSSCTCSEADVAPVFADDYQYLCRIGEPRERYDVFKSPYKLKWAKTLKGGEKAYARIRKRAGVEDAYAAVEIRWIGQTRIGMKFGVEIIDSAYKGQGDPSVSKYFKCADEKNGMLLDLDALECDKLLHPAINWNTGATAATTVVESPPATTDSSAGDNPRVFDNLLKADNAAMKEKRSEAEIQIASLEAQLKRELSKHQAETKRLEDELKEQVKRMEASETFLQNELMKKAENHAAELSDAIENQQQLMKEREKEQRKLIQELNDHFQNEIKAAHYQWEQVIAHTWQVERDDIEMTDITLGKGRLGIVMKGNFRGIEVAVKKLHPDLVSENNEKLIKWEINLLAQVRHPNLVLFLGAVISSPKAEDHASLIVTELLDVSLQSAYQKGEMNSAESKLAILSDIASALAYLHTNRVPIIHKDLSSSRVLLEAIGGSHKWRAKLSVFGIVNIIPSASYERSSVYAAPEVVIADVRHQTDRVDVYSFGVLVCEVVLCRFPPERKEDLPVMLSDVHAHDHNLFQLAMNCTKQSHQDRPSMIEVTQKLRALL